MVNPPYNFNLRLLTLFRFVGLTGKKEGKTRLMNMVMQVRYCYATAK